MSEEDDVDDVEDEDEDAEDEAQTDGRQWVLISRGPDCVVHAMQINGHPDHQAYEALGTLVRVEVWGDDDGEYACSTQYLSGVLIRDLLIETKPEDPAPPEAPQ